MLCGEAQAVLAAVNMGETKGHVIMSCQPYTPNVMLTPNPLCHELKVPVRTASSVLYSVPFERVRILIPRLHLHALGNTRTYSLTDHEGSR